MKLIKNECKMIINIPSESRTTDESLKEFSEEPEEVIDPIYGLGFS
jgi:hypothetical protein